jgi:arabinose-5-phosphate isomerase
MLALGDALALTVMEQKDIQPEHYATFHPAGALGRSLLRVAQIMRTGDDNPAVAQNATLQDCFAVVQRAPRRAGATSVIDDAGRLVGFFTQGDLFRLVQQPGFQAERLIREVMNPNPKRALDTDRVAEALTLMRRHRIDELPVVDEADRLVGLIDVQDLIAHGFSAFDGP